MPSVKILPHPPPDDEGPVPHPGYITKRIELWVAVEKIIRYIDLLHPDLNSLYIAYIKKVGSTDLNTSYGRSQINRVLQDILSDIQGDDSYSADARKMAEIIDFLYVIPMVSDTLNRFAMNEKHIEFKKITGVDIMDFEKGEPQDSIHPIDVEYMALFKCLLENEKDEYKGKYAYANRYTINTGVTYEMVYIQNNSGNKSIKNPLDLFTKHGMEFFKYSPSKKITTLKSVMDGLKNFKSSGCV